MILLETERSYLFAEVNTQYQDWNYRALEGNLLKGILDKLSSVSISFTKVENSKIQYLIKNRAEVLARLTDPRLQFILQSNKGPVKDQNRFFHSGSQYQLCQSILSKLAGQ